MAKDRERACRWYKNENNCSKGHEGTFNKACQKCKDYEPKKGALPRRKDLRKIKNIKWMNDFKNFE